MRLGGRSAGCFWRAGVGGHFEEVEDPARVSCEVAHGLGDGEAAFFDEADGEAPEACDVLRAVTGTDAAAVFVEAPVEDVVCSFDGPVSSIEGEEALWRGGLGVEAGDPIGGFAVAFAGLDLDGFSPHGEDLTDAGEVEVGVEFAGNPDGTTLVAAVFGLCGFGGEVRCAPGDALVEQEVDIVIQVGLIALDGEQIVGAAVEEIIGEGALGEQGIGGEGEAGDIGQGVEQGNGGADLVGALLAVGGIGPQADFFWAQDALLSWPTMPST